MTNLIETRIATYAFAAFTEDEESELKDVCRRFARNMHYDFHFEYYAIYWEEENWTLANLAMPGIDQILKRIP